MSADDLSLKTAAYEGFIADYIHDNNKRCAKVLLNVLDRQRLSTEERERLLAIAGNTPPYLDYCTGSALRENTSRDATFRRREGSSSSRNNSLPSNSVWGTALSKESDGWHYSSRDTTSKETVDWAAYEALPAEIRRGTKRQQVQELLTFILDRSTSGGGWVDMRVLSQSGLCSNASNPKLMCLKALNLIDVVRDGSVKPCRPL